MGNISQKSVQSSDESLKYIEKIFTQTQDSGSLDYTSKLLYIFWRKDANDNVIIGTIDKRNTYMKFNYDFKEKKQNSREDIYERKNDWNEFKESFIQVQDAKQITEDITLNDFITQYINNPKIIILNTQQNQYFISRILQLKKTQKIQIKILIKVNQALVIHFVSKIISINIKLYLKSLIRQITLVLTGREIKYKKTRSNLYIKIVFNQRLLLKIQKKLGKSAAVINLMKNFQRMRKVEQSNEILNYKHYINIIYDISSLHYFKFYFQIEVLNYLLQNL